MSTKAIDPRALGSITTGILLLDDFGKVHEAIIHVLGREVWTHELPSVSAEATAAVLRQFPDMPTDVGGDWKATATAITSKFGALVDVEQGHTKRTAGPVETLVAIMAESRS